MPKSIIIKKNGGPEVLEIAEVKIGSPGPHEIKIKNLAIGLNYIDTYHRSGLYPLTLPSGIGLEGAGKVIEIGSNVKIFNIGDDIAYASTPIGAYAEERIIPEKIAVKIPEGITHKIAATLMTKGLTTFYLLHKTFPVKSGQKILFHAAAGGVGQIAGQWARSIGAIAIGVVGNKNKEEYARKCGYKFVFNMEDHDIVSEIMKITNNKGVDVVYDSVGLTTWNISLSCVKKLGLIVSFGSASGNPPLYDIAKDGIKNSAFIHRATMVNYMTSSKIARDSAARVFEKIKNKEIQLNLNKNYQLKDVKIVHRDAEARKTIGQIVMKV